MSTEEPPRSATTATIWPAQAVYNVVLPAHIREQEERERSYAGGIHSLVKARICSEQRCINPADARPRSAFTTQGPSSHLSAERDSHGLDSLRPLSIIPLDSLRFPGRFRASTGRGVAGVAIRRRHRRLDSFRQARSRACSSFTFSAARRQGCSSRDVLAEIIEFQAAILEELHQLPITGSESPDRQVRHVPPPERVTREVPEEWAAILLRVAAVGQQAQIARAVERVVRSGFAPASSSSVG